MKRIAFLAGILAASAALVALSASCKSPASAKEKDPKKPEASLDYHLEKEPTITWNWEGGTLHIENAAIVTSLNAVGGTVDYLEIKWYMNSTLVSTTTHAGGGFAGYGTLTIRFNSTCSRQYEPDTVTFRISGRDANGYTINKTLTYYWSWDSPSGLSLAATARK